MLLRLGRFAVAAALLASGCGIPQEKYSETLDKLDQCKTDLNRRDADLTTSHLKLDKTNADLDESKRKVDELNRAQAELGSNAKAIETELEQLRRQHVLAEQRAEVYRTLVSKLKAMIDARTLGVEIRKGKMLVKLGDQVLFDAGKSELTASGQAALKQVAAALKEIPDRDFLVAGHTDNQPIKSSPYRSNWELSTARAVTVVRFLQSEGVDPRHLAAAGYSEFDSVARNDTGEERAFNRRIEIVVMPNLDELPSVSARLPEEATTAPGGAAPAPAPPRVPTPAAPATPLR